MVNQDALANFPAVDDDPDRLIGRLVRRNDRLERALTVAVQGLQAAHARITELEAPPAEPATDEGEK